MNKETKDLELKIEELHALVENSQIQNAATNSVLLVLMRYLAEAKQLYISELCTDLDVLCSAQNHKVWQTSIIAITESLRTLDANLPKDDY